MNFDKHAYILETVEALKKHGSWCGKTHVQKTLFLLQQLQDESVPFQYVFYKHGPYSFEVESEIEQMKSYGAINIEPVAGYGVVINPDRNADYIRRKGDLSTEMKVAIEALCQYTGPMGVAELERVSTSAWVRFRENIRDPDAVATRIHTLKPHISPEEARKADANVLSWAVALSGVRVP
ncbi:MAG: hypothetical protein ACLQVD_05475 [Capsulimonadaceae bacterium]